MGRRQQGPLTWSMLNVTLKEIEREDEVLALLKSEATGQRRPLFMLRIYSRYNVLRARREKAEILKENYAGKLGLRPSR